MTAQSFENKNPVLFFKYVTMLFVGLDNPFVLPGRVKEHDPDAGKLV